MPIDVLDHDHGRVDDEPEIDRPDREQIRGIAADHQQPDRKEQRERNGGGDDDGAAQIAQRNPLQQEYQHNAQHHVVQDGARRDVDQVLAVVDPLDPHPRRQHAGGVDLLDLGLDAADGRQALLSAPHQDDALHDLILVVLTDDAETRPVTDGDFGDVADQHRHAALLGQHGIANVVQRADEAHAAHHGRLLADIERLTADVYVGVVQRLHQLRQGEADRLQLEQIHRHLVSLGLAAEPHDVDDARNRLEAPLQYPVLQRLEISHAIVWRAHDLVTHDLADRAPGRNLRLGAVRQGSKLRQPVQHLLLGLLVGIVVGELQLDVRKAEQRDRAHRRDVRNAG